MAPFLAPVLILASVIFLFSDVVFSAAPLIASSGRHDAASLFVPWLSFCFNALRGGDFALWNPHIFSGVPSLGSFEPALLYPPNWLHLFLPLTRAVNALIVFHVGLAGLLTYGWCRHRGIGAAGSFLGGMTFMLSGPYFLHIYAGHLPHLSTMSWAPAVFWALDGWRPRKSKKWLLLGMLAVSMQIFAGNPQYAYYTALGAFLYAGFGAAPIYAGGAVLAAVQLLPGCDAALESVRGGGLSHDYAASFSLPLKNILTLFAPDLFSRAGYSGRPYFWETCLYVGGAGLALGIYGAMDRAGRRLAWLSVIFLALALGANTPLFEPLYKFLPGYSLFRGTAKFGFLVSLFLSVLAAIGLDRLVRTGRPRLRQAAYGLGFIAVAQLMLFARSSRVVMPLELVYPAQWKQVLDENPGDYRVLHDPAHWPNVGMILGVQDLWGYGYFVFKRYAQFMTAVQGQNPDTASQYLKFDKFPPILSMLRCRFVFLADKKETIIRLPSPMPRLHLLREWSVMTGRDSMFKALLDPKFDPRKKVLLEAPPIPAPENSGAGMGTVSLLSASNGSLEVSAELPRAAILLITDLYAKGWRVLPFKGSAQSRYDLAPANYVLRAVPLSAGRHHFLVEYSPLSFRVGKWISTVGFFVYGLFCLWGAFNFCNRKDIAQNGRAG